MQIVREASKPRPRFIEPMECRAVSSLPEGDQWVYEVKQDGYRAEAVIDGSTVVLHSMAGLNFNDRFPLIVQTLKRLKLNSAVLDGEVVALDEQGRASFNELQNYKTTKRPLAFFVFDLLHLRGADLLNLPLTERKARLEGVAKRFSSPVILNQHFAVGLDAFIEKARGLGIEGVVAKRASSFYRAGERSDDWQKKHFKEQGKFAIGGYIPGPQAISELIVGVDESVLDGFPPAPSKMLSKELSKYPPGSLLFINSINAGLEAFNRRHLHEELKPLRTSKCPFANLPERRIHKHAVTADKMSLCMWVKPERCCELAFHECTPSAHLRHPEFRVLAG